MACTHSRTSQHHNSISISFQQLKRASSLPRRIRLQLRRVRLSKALMERYHGSSSTRLVEPPTASPMCTECKRRAGCNQKHVGTSWASLRCLILPCTGHTDRHSQSHVRLFNAPEQIPGRRFSFQLHRAFISRFGYILVVYFSLISSRAKVLWSTEYLALRASMVE